MHREARGPWLSQRLKSLTSHPVCVQGDGPLQRATQNSTMTLPELWAFPPRVCCGGPVVMAGEGVFGRQYRLWLRRGRDYCSGGSLMVVMVVGISEQLQFPWRVVSFFSFDKVRNSHSP